MQGDVSTVGDVELTVAETTTDDRAELGRIADAFREGKRNAVLVLFSSAGRGAIHVALTDDLVSAGRKAGDLVNRIAALSGGKGGGRPHFASAGAGDPERLPAARAATPELVAAWLGNRQRGRSPRRLMAWATGWTGTPVRLRPHSGTGSEQYALAASGPTPPSNAGRSRPVGAGTEPSPIPPIVRRRSIFSPPMP